MEKVEAKVFISKKIGLTLYVEPETKEWDSNRRKEIIVPAKIIKFVDGKFVAKTKQEIEYLDNYCIKRPDVCFPIAKESEKLVKALNKIKEDERQAKEKAGQGVAGRKITTPVEVSKKAGQGAAN